MRFPRKNEKPPGRGGRPSGFSSRIISIELFSVSMGGFPVRSHVVLASRNGLRNPQKDGLGQTF